MGDGASRRIRIVICDDSRTFCAAVTRVLEHESRLEVVGVFETAERAVEAVGRLRPDLVVMDHELPGMSGLEAVERIMAEHPVPILVVSSVASEIELAARSAGAVDAISKHDLDLTDPAGASAGALRRQAERLSRARVVRRHAGMRGPCRPARAATVRAVSVIGICASAGGQSALLEALAGLDAVFPIPIVVVQHLSGGFTEDFVAYLDSRLAPPVRVASVGTPVDSGIWIAPEGAHLLIRPGGRVVLDPETAHGYHRPSADLLFDSLAATYGNRAVAVVLTGMGSDGALGLQAVGKAGGLTITQDEGTSVAYGMPRAAADHGAEFVLPLPRIAASLAALVPVRHGVA